MFQRRGRGKGGAPRRTKKKQILLQQGGKKGGWQATGEVGAKGGLAIKDMTVVVNMGEEMNAVVAEKGKGAKGPTVGELKHQICVLFGLLFGAETPVPCLPRSANSCLKAAYLELEKGRS